MSGVDTGRSTITRGCLLPGGFLVTLEAHREVIGVIKRLWFSFADLHRQVLIAEGIQERPYSDGFTVDGCRPRKTQNHQSPNVLHQSTQIFTVLLTSGAQLSLIQSGLVRPTVPCTKFANQIT